MQTFSRPLLWLAAFAALATGLSPEALAGERLAPNYRQALEGAARSDPDRARDSRDKPAEVLAFAGFAPGMKIADIFGGGGYYSEILAAVVGPRGHVILVNNPPYAAYVADDLAARFRGDRLAAVERRVVPSEDLQLGAATLDGALMVMAYHDLYYADGKEFPRIDAGQFLAQLHRALKPGGRLLIVDHAATPGSGSSAAQTLHRIDETFAIADLQAHGFKLLRKYDGLRNPADNHRVGVFDATVHGHTDRFVHLYQRQ